MNILNFLLFIVLILNLCYKRKFINRINTLYKMPSLLKVGYWIDYCKNFNIHVKNLENLVELELNKYPNLKDEDKENIIKYTPYKELTKIHFYQKYNINLFTMMTPLLVSNLVKHIDNTRNIDGAMVDVGCWRGGSSIIMKKYNNEKDLYILDAFGSMDNNIVNKDDNELNRVTIKVLNVFSQYFKEPIISTSFDIVRNNFKKLNVSLKNVTFIKGNLKDKDFGYDKIDKISLLRIDCDFYKPTYNVLQKLYPKVEKGGVIILNDFNIPFLEGKQAVLGYLKRNKIEKEIFNVGQSAYFIK